MIKSLVCIVEAVIDYGQYVPLCRGATGDDEGRPTTEDERGSPRAAALLSLRMQIISTAKGSHAPPPRHRGKGGWRDKKGEGCAPLVVRAKWSLSVGAEGCGAGVEPARESLGGLREEQCEEENALFMEQGKGASCRALEA